MAAAITYGIIPRYQPIILEVIFAHPCLRDVGDVGEEN